ncbi:MAG: fimbrial chaperone [Bacteroidales bacterium]
MNKIKSVWLWFGLLVLTFQVNAAFTLNGTRFIYDEDSNNVSVEVSNESNVTYGGQIWVSNFRDNDKDVYLIPSPSFFKVEGKQKQVVRIMEVNNNLPKDRESLFWINVQEVPPVPEASEGGSSLALAMNIQVKLIYRPSSVKEQRNNAEQKIRLVKDGLNMYLENPTPFYFAVSGILYDGEFVNVGNDNQISRLAPFSRVHVVDIDIPAAKAVVSVEAINDFGGKQLYEISAAM